MRATFGRAAPELLETQYAHEIWRLYEASELTPESALNGRFTPDPTAPDVDAVLKQIEDERREAEARQRRRDAADAI
jgi:RIO kinase 1